jgi:hypothetical protein
MSTFARGIGAAHPTYRLDEPLARITRLDADYDLRIAPADADWLPADELVHGGSGVREHTGRPPPLLALAEEDRTRRNRRPAVPHG